MTVSRRVLWVGLGVPQPAHWAETPTMTTNFSLCSPTARCDNCGKPTVDHTWQATTTGPGGGTVDCSEVDR